MYIFLFLLVTWGCHGVDLQKVQSCKKIVKTATHFSYFNMNGKPLKSRGIFITIPVDSESECALNTTEIIDILELPDVPIEATVAVLCKGGNRIILSNYSGAIYKHVLFHVEVGNCTVDLDNLDNLVNIGDTKVLVVIKASNKSSTNFENRDESLHNLVSFVYSNRENVPQPIETIFNISQAYPQLAEIMLTNMSLEVLPSNIDEIFPNLQSLELPGNNIKLPPLEFPWTEYTVLLPRNLSRTPFMHSHYSLSEHIEIPDNIFRRFFDLDNNNITDLQNFSFHGTLDKISLRKNGLQAIGNETFSNVNDLQNLDLSENELEVLPGGVFRKMTSLRNLDLSSNRIRTLTVGLFNDLRSLMFLNLGNNSLVSLPEYVFTALQNVKEIRLNHNQIKHLNPYSFPLSSIKLKELHFQSNPIEILPEFVLWIRSLVLADFSSTAIRFENFTKYLEDADHTKVYQSVVDSASSSDFDDLLKRADELRDIDLTNCSITSLKLEENIPQEIDRFLQVLLLHFKFKLRNNPLICDCNINEISAFIAHYVANGTIPSDEYFFEEWICREPRELEDLAMLLVQSKDTYCLKNITNCPEECKCYQRAEVEHVIVDCRRKTLKRIHDVLPDAILELWYSENNITEIKELTRPENIYMLDVGYNKINFLDTKMFEKMVKLKDVRLNSNVLAYLPAALKMLDLEKASIWPNPFTCDCNTRWMKSWLQDNSNIISDSDKVACKIESEDGMLFTEVPDEKFVCHEDSKFDELRHVIMPSIVSSTVVIIVLIFAVVLYAYRLECKVLLFVYFGIHPFDNDSAKNYESIDCVVVHSGIQTDWVMEKIVSVLENKNYHFVVCDMARDFVVGYSLQENLTRTVRHSKRMIFCLSGDWSTSGENFVIAWRIAQEKIKETKSHYGIIVSHEAKVKEIKDKDLRMFIKRGRFVDSKDKLFRNKIVYYMPQNITPMVQNLRTKNINSQSEFISRCFINSYCEDTALETEVRSADDIDARIQPTAHAFVSYHDDDFQYVLNELLPLLEEQGFSYCISDRDFVPGASIEENILSAINRCHRTIFVLSPSHVQDEWSLFTFRAAYEKSLREKSNHLLVIEKGEVESENLDEEISHYLNNYMCLNVNDKWFEKKLFNGLPLLRNKEVLHSSPLFVNIESIPEECVSFNVN